MNVKDWIIIILLIFLSFIAFWAVYYPMMQKNCIEEAGKMLLNNFINQLNNFGYVTIPTNQGNIILVVNRTWRP